MYIVLNTITKKHIHRELSFNKNYSFYSVIQENFLYLQKSFI